MYTNVCYVYLHNLVAATRSKFRC